MENIKLFAATKAFVTNSKGEVLLLRESSKYEDGTQLGRYDIVGGRIKPGERFDDSLLREIKEETGLEATIQGVFHMDEWRPEVRGEKWQIVATFFKCEVTSDEVTLSSDHDQYIWIKPTEYKNYNILDNLGTAFEAYLNNR